MANVFYLNIYFGSQFCDKAKVAIIPRKIEPNLAKN
jgi:hypothetical protein